MSTRPLTHIALIMDGNRRWAKRHKLQTIAGHQYATDHTIEPIIKQAVSLAIPHLTFWALSTENWHRPASEIKGIMQVIRHGLAKNLETWVAAGWRLNVIGDLSRFPSDIRQGLAHWIKASQANTKINLTFALNYGGRDEIIRAIKSIPPAQLSTLTEENFNNYLDTAGQPEPDIIIRTGGRYRLSGFLPYQSVYSELFFTSTLWPDFSPDELTRIVRRYRRRQRNFGR